MIKTRLPRARYKEVARRLNMSGRACRAGERVLVDGFTLPRAAEAFGISKQAVSQAVARILAHALQPGAPCPTCGAPIQKSRARTGVVAHDI